MKLTPRRIAAGISAAAAAVLLPTAALAASSGAAAPAQAAAQCTAGHTRVWLGEPAEGATSHLYIQLEFSNVGSTACSFNGFPGVSELKRSGKQVGKPAIRRGPSNGTITLQPGDTAHVVLVLVQAGAACPGHEVHGTTLRVFPPNQFGPQLLTFPAGACPGVALMSVDSMHSKAGIPFYSGS